MPKAVEHYSIQELADYAHVKVLFTGMKALTQRFHVSTEDLRLALQRYRSFFDRLLKL